MGHVLLMCSSNNVTSDLLGGSPSALEASPAVALDSALQAARYVTLQDAAAAVGIQLPILKVGLGKR